MLTLKLPNLTMPNAFLFYKIIGIILITTMFIILPPMYRKYSEGFQNLNIPSANEACAILKKNHAIVVKTMAAIPTNVSNTRDQINNGVNYHDMQSRDIVMGDEKTSWCNQLNEEEQINVLNAIGSEVGTEVEIFDGGRIMDRDEEQSNADGIAYNGADAFDSEYARV
jgi:hypothetical protein